MTINPVSIKKDTTADIVEPISLAEAKAHLRIDQTHDDAYITALISMVRESVEISTRRTLVQGFTNYTAGYDRYPLHHSKLRIPLPPTIEILSLGFYDVENNSNTVFTGGTLPSEAIAEIEGSGSAFLAMEANHGYESLSRERIAPVLVTFKAGYQDVSIPAALKQAMYLLLSHYYDTREMVAFNRNPVSIPRSVEFLINQYKIRLT